MSFYADLDRDVLGRVKALGWTMGYRRAEGGAAWWFALPPWGGSEVTAPTVAELLRRVLSRERRKKGLR